MKNDPRFSYYVMIEHHGTRGAEFYIKYDVNLSLRDALLGMRAYLLAWGTIPDARIWNTLGDEEDRRIISAARKAREAMVQP